MDLRRALRGFGLGAMVVGALAYPAAWAIDRAAGTEVLQVHAADAETVETNRQMWELNGSEKAGVAEIYGTPTGKPERIVFANSKQLLQPQEDPSLTLYVVAQEDHPLQAQTLWYFALPATVGGILGGAALLLLARRKKPAA